MLLAAVAALLAWFVRRDLAEYAAFKALTRTEDRQRVLRRWTWRSFLIFLGSTLAVLLLLGRLDALIHMPAEFRLLSDRLAGLVSDEGPHGFSPDFLMGLGGAIVGGAIAGSILAAWLARRGGRQPSARPDIEPLLPRNRGERRWTALLGANAGPSEETFFRLMLPLLLVSVTGNAVLAFALAAAAFGILHLYQGWLGVVVTGLAGLFFTAVYLATGNIWIAALLHSLINLNALWLRPFLNERFARGD